jgi:UDP-glucose 4-epimerase
MEITNRRFLVTGGASLVGSHIAEHLLNAGAREVVLFDNLSLAGEEPIHDLLADPRIRLVRGDIRNVHQLLEATSGVDGVFATAAYITNPLNGDPLTGVQVNVVGHQMVLEACRWNTVRKLIYSSSVGIYGTPAADEISETHSLNYASLSPAATLYAAGKVIGEQMSRIYQERYGVDFVALRYATVYGERQHARGINSLIILDAYDRIRGGLPPQVPGDGTEVHDYVHVVDVARANVIAMAGDVKGESFTIASGVETSFNEIYEIVLRIAGSALRPEHIADATRVRGVATPHLRFSREKAEKILGWTPQIRLEEGIRRLLEWRERTLRRSAA